MIRLEITKKAVEELLNEKHLIKIYKERKRKQLCKKYGLMLFEMINYEVCFCYTELTNV